MQPPPPYASPPSSSKLPSFHVAVTTLPPNLLLNIIYATFPQVSLIDEGKLERQRKTLYWLSTSLRLVNRTFYFACMHVLRSTYLPAYDSLIRPPYTSDPFPLLSPIADAIPPPSSPYGPSLPPLSAQSAQPSLKTIQRETATLDLFIALKVREDVWSDDSEFHLERDESFRDLFDHSQPRSRLEDLIRIYGIRENVVTLESSPSPAISTILATSHLSRSNSSPDFPRSTSFFSSLIAKKPKAGQQVVVTPPRSVQITPIPFHRLSVSFSPRQVSLTLHPAKRTIVTTQRTRDEKLEMAAKRLVRELRSWLEEGG